jgi:hypothetical protein
MGLRYMKTYVHSCAHLEYTLKFINWFEKRFEQTL